MYVSALLSVPDIKISYWIPASKPDRVWTTTFARIDEILPFWKFLQEIVVGTGAAGDFKTKKCSLNV